MELIKELDVRESVIKTGPNKGTVKRKRWGLFKCPSCSIAVEHIMYTGAKRNSCGAKGCKSAASTKYGHRKLPEGTTVISQPYFKLFNDFYNRNLRNNTTVVHEWDTFNKFKDEMYDSYVALKDTGIKAITLFLDNSLVITASNVRWVDASKLSIKEYTADIDAGVFHSKRLAKELNTQHYTVVSAIKKLVDVIGTPLIEVTTQPGFISKLSTAYILTEESYIRVRNKLIDGRNSKNTSDTVYLASCGERIKIGITNNIKSRMQTLVGCNRRKTK